MSSMTVGEMNTFNTWMVLRGLRKNIDALRAAGMMDEMWALANEYAAEFRRLGGRATVIPPAR